MYGGLHFGYGNADANLDFETGAESSVALQFRGDGNGGVAGAHVGYNVQLNNIVQLNNMNNIIVGVEGDADWLFGWEAEGPLSGTNTSAAFAGDIDYLASIRARIGIVIDGDSLLSVSGGVAFTNADQIFRNGNTTEEHVEHDLGAVFGVGFEHRVSNRLSIRGEALYYYFGDEDWICEVDCGGLTGGVGDTAGVVSLGVYTFRMGVSYHF